MAGKKILLIDDEQIVKELTETMLETLDHQVISFEDADEAFSYFSGHSKEFDLVITDQSMPTMTGVELAKKIKEISPLMPVIISTGHSSQQIQEQLDTNSSCLVLEKPFNLDQLEKLVKSS